MQALRSKIDTIRKKSVKGFLFRKLRAGVLHDAIPCSRRKIFSQGNKIVEVIGLFHSASGLGESARLCARQLREGGYDVRCASAEPFFTERRDQAREVPWDCQKASKAGDVGCRIIHLNPPMMPQVIFGLGLDTHVKTYNIGYWAWELDDVNREWRRAISHMNAIFCCSDFTSGAMRKHTSKPVITVPHPVNVSHAAPAPMRAKLGIAEDVFLASSIFNFGSVMERKNPHGTISAFLSAFEGDDKALLVIKTNSGGDGADQKEILERIKPYKNIRLIDEVWSREELLGLMKDSNAYISLHRSEGFGLPIAEAMLLGTPVVITNWSGNVDFCNGGNSCLIDADLIPVSSKYPEFRQLLHLKWADADIFQAAEALKRLAKDPACAKAIGERAKAESEEFFSRPVYMDALKNLAAI
jgi:glycosyltransferase involved in cell wall biosynthesis